MTNKDESFTNCLTGVIVSTIIVLLTLGAFLIGLKAGWHVIILSFLAVMFLVSVSLDIYCIVDFHKIIKRNNEKGKS